MPTDAELDAMRKDNIRATQAAEDAAADAREADARRGMTNAEAEVKEATSSIAKKFKEQVLGDDTDEELPQDD